MNIQPAAYLSATIYDESTHEVQLADEILRRRGYAKATVHHPYSQFRTATRTGAYIFCLVLAIIHKTLHRSAQPRAKGRQLWTERFARDLMKRCCTLQTVGGNRSHIPTEDLLEKAMSSWPNGCWSRRTIFFFSKNLRLPGMKRKSRRSYGVRSIKQTSVVMKNPAKQRGIERTQ
jgi:hypothetical protein